MLLASCYAAINVSGDYINVDSLATTAIPDKMGQLIDDIEEKFATAVSHIILQNLKVVRLSYLLHKFTRGRGEVYIQLSSIEAMKAMAAGSVLTQRTSSSSSSHF